MSKTNSPETGHLFLAGIVLALFGIVAIATPAVAGTAVVYVIGGVLLVAGITQFIQGLRAEKWSSKLLPIVLGVVTAACGIGVLGHPLFGLEFLALLLAIYFTIGGLWKIIASFAYRPVTSWLFMLGSGLVSLVLGVFILQQWPLSGPWAVGILVGVDLLITGASMVALATTIRRQRKIPAGASPA